MLNQEIRANGGSVVSTALFLSIDVACGDCETTQEPAAPAATAPNPLFATVAPDTTANSIVANVNDNPIPLSAVTRSSHRPGGDPLAMDKAISHELMRQKVIKLELPQDPATEQLDNLLRTAHAQFGAERFINQLNIAIKELKTAFNNRHPLHQSGEYRAGHFLQSSEAKAREVVAKLQKGDKFASLARKFSKDPGNQKLGGDLGWFELARMDSVVATTIAALHDVEFTQDPVQSQFDRQVTLREDARKKAPADFAKEKEKLRNQAQINRVATVSSGTANVEPSPHN